MSNSAPAGLSLGEEFKVYYATDPDPDKAGQGLSNAPFMKQALGRDSLQYWLMSPAEQMGLLCLLQHVRPKVAIEIGTRFGGSLQVLSRFCDRVYSLDIDPEVPGRLQGAFANVEFIIGPSKTTLPPLIKRLQAKGEDLGFALVDGDHSTRGVKEDIDNLLAYVPMGPFYIVMHDSFNPACRQGLRLANWSANPYVHVVELDFVPGFVNPAPDCRGELWGGLAMAYLNANKRVGQFEVTAGGEMTFQAGMAARPRRSLRSLVGAAMRRVKRLLK